MPTLTWLSGLGDWSHPNPRNIINDNTSQTQTVKVGLLCQNVHLISSPFFGGASSLPKTSIKQNGTNILPYLTHPRLQSWVASFAYNTGRSESKLPCALVPGYHPYSSPRMHHRVPISAPCPFDPRRIWNPWGLKSHTKVNLIYVTHCPQLTSPHVIDRKLFIIMFFGRFLKLTFPIFHPVPIFVA